jgi:hypothetical protein
MVRADAGGHAGALRSLSGGVFVCPKSSMWPGPVFKMKQWLMYASAAVGPNR